MKPAPRRYDAVTIALHWLVAAGIALVWSVESLRGELLPKGSPLREALKAMHEPAGLILLGLIVLRLVWRATHRQPEPPADMRDWELRLARWTHRALYAGMLAAPLLGILATFARGRPVDLGLLQLASPFGSGLARPLAKAIKEAHELAVNLLLGLALLHALAALWHHYVRGDDVLVRMLPGRAASHREG